jgi:prolyl 4-hydroxylase
MKFEYNIIDDFISSENCQSLITYFTPILKPSDVIGDQSLRNSEDFFIDTDAVEDGNIKQILLDLKLKLSKLSGLPIENQELLTIIRYKPGQEFKPHLDAFSENELEIESILGGQRKQTYIICLRQSNGGGETHFPKLDKKIILKSGQCINWKNTDDEGTTYTESLHAGLTPKDGEKWIITCWIRESKYFPLGHDFTKNLLNFYSKEYLKGILNEIPKN